MTTRKKAVASFRFYEELNDFLPLAERKRDIEIAFHAPVPVRHLIEALGVPHTEIELIMANGISLGLDHPVADRECFSVYPMFESLDVTPLVRLREKPLRQPLFVADAHLGKLAHYLRMLGFDTSFENAWTDRKLADISAAENRILLTRDKALLMHRAITHGCYIRATEPKEQLTFLVRRLDLCRLIQPFTRCMKCNGRLHSVNKDRIYDQIPLNTRCLFHSFWRCSDCTRIYWRGSHYQRMREFIARLEVSSDCKASPLAP